MISILVNFLHSKITEITELSQLENLKLKLGLECVMRQLILAILVFAVALVYGVLGEAIVFWLVFAAVRSVAGGAHLKNGAACTIATTIIIVGGTVMALNIPYSIFSWAVIVPLSLFIVFKFAPKYSENYPIKYDQIQKIKIQTILLILLLDTTGILVQNKWTNIILCAVLAELITVIPGENHTS